MTDLNLDALARELAPILAEGEPERDAAARFVFENYAALQERKVFSALVPRGYGGGGARHSEMCAFLRAIAGASPSTALALSMHQHLVATAIVNDAAGRKGRALLEKVARDEAILVSTGANDWLASNGEARRVEGGYRVTARKPFASGGPAGDTLVTSARFRDPEQGRRVLHFALDLHADGVKIGEDWDTLGMRATGSHAIQIEESFVPDAAITLDRPQGGWHPLFSVVLTAALPLIMSAYLGVAERAADIARRRARQRPDDPAQAYLLGELANALTTARLAVESMVAIANDLDVVPSIETADAMAIRKTIATDAILASAEKALETVGGAGYFRGLGLERLLRDVHAAQFHPMQAKRQHLFSGRVALGLDPIETAADAEG